jgi:hypothetical protein
MTVSGQDCPLLTGDELGWRLAALADGEGCFAMTISGSKRQSFRCFFIVGMRSDDRPFLELMQTSTGLGHLFDLTPSIKALARRPGTNPQTHWGINAYHEVLALAAIFDRYPPISKKARDYAIWREALDVWGERDWGRMAVLKEALSEGRIYDASPIELPEPPQLRIDEVLV